MSNQRKQIIINEITFWKQNKLLPEHYCDFLMTLYTEGEQAEETLKGNAKQSVMGKQTSSIRLRYFMMPLVALALIIAMYILAQPIVVIIVAVLVSLGCVGYGIYIAKKNGVLSPLLHLTGALLLLFATLKVCLQYYPGNDTALYVTLISNCVFWLISGLLMRLMYFTIAGALGLVAIVVYSVL